MIIQVEKHLKSNVNNKLDAELNVHHFCLKFKGTFTRGNIYIYINFN